MDVVCRKTTCRFNEGQKCDRKHLSVTSVADCGDVKVDPAKKPDDISKRMFDKTPSYAPYKHCKCIEIKCNATDCLFNKDKLCTANGIFVNSRPKNAECCTYIKMIER